MLLFTLREGRKKKTQERERERSERFFFFLAQHKALIRSGNQKFTSAHSARHEFISLIAGFYHHRQEEKRTLIRDSLSLPVFTLSLSLCVLVVVVCFHFSPTKVGGRYKNKNSLPSSLSLVWTKVYAHHRLKCYNCVIKGLHEYFIGNVTFFCHHRRALSLLRPYEREREREREKERKRRARKNDGRKFCTYKIRETWKKNKSLLLLFCRDSRQRERER